MITSRVAGRRPRRCRRRQLRHVPRDGVDVGRHRAFEWGASADRLDDRRHSTASAPRRRRRSTTTTTSGSWRGASAGWRRGDGVGARRPALLRPTSAASRARSAAIRSASSAASTSMSRGDNDRRSAVSRSGTPLVARASAARPDRRQRLDSDFASPFGASESYLAPLDRAARRSIPTVAPRLDASAGVELQRERAGSTFITGAANQHVPVERSRPATSAKARWNSQRRVVRDRRASASTTSGASARGDRRIAFSPRPALPRTPSSR